MGDSVAGLQAGLLSLLAFGIIMASGAAARAQESPETTPPSASGGVLLPEQGAVDVLHYTVTLTIDPEHRSIAGSGMARMKVVGPLTEAVLHLDQRLEVEGVSVSGEDRPFRHGDGLVRVALPSAPAVGSEFEMTVRYGGIPRSAPNAPWDGGFTWRRTPSGKPWIATTCQGEGADLWWPCKDHPSDEPSTMDLHITVPKDLVVATNGVLVKVESAGRNTHTFHWHVKNPINNYAVALNIAPYEVLKRTYKSVTGEDVPVEFYVLPEDVEKGKKFLDQVLDHLHHMEEVCGPYPFRSEKYGVAQTPHLGMEHQTIIAYGNKFNGLRGGYDWLHHHEMSHEWWGNLVTCRDWKDMWIHEGIGTYMQALYLESRRGPEAYHAEMRSKRGHRNARPVAPRESQDSKQIYFGNNGNDIYNKGSWVMHTLRWVMGDKPFFVALRRMAYPDPAMEKVTDGSQTRFSDTEDIRSIAEAHHGSDLSWFFEVYLRRADPPRLGVEEDGGKLRLLWQTPDDLPFPMPVPVRIGDEIRRIEMPGGRAVIDLKGKSYEVDPEDRVLKARPARGPRRGR